MNKKYLKIFIVFLIFSLAINIFIIVECSLPAAPSETQSDWVADVIGNIMNIPPTDEFAKTIRKSIGHFGIFMLSGIFTSFAALYGLKMKEKYTLLSFFIFSIIPGICMAFLSEIIQLFVPGRYFAFQDVLIDLGGYVSSFLILFVILIIVEKKNNKTKVE